MRYVSHVRRKAPEHKVLSLKDSLLILKSKKKKKRGAKGQRESRMSNIWGMTNKYNLIMENFSYKKFILKAFKDGENAYMLSKKRVCPNYMFKI